MDSMRSRLSLRCMAGASEEADLLRKVLSVSPAAWPGREKRGDTSTLGVSPHVSVTTARIQVVAGQPAMRGPRMSHLQCTEDGEVRI